MLLPFLGLCLLLSGCGRSSVGTSVSLQADSSAAFASSSSALSLPDGYTDVQTHWDALTPYEPPQPLYTRYAEDTDRLTVRDDYGILLPYVGRMMDVDDYILDKLPMYGLTTAQGKIVTDPVYADIWRNGNFLILLRPEVRGSHEETWGTALDGKFQRTIAAPDGSWVRVLDDSVGDYGEVDEGHLALYRTDDTISILDDANAITCTFAGADIRAGLGPGYQPGSLTLDDVESRGIFINWYGNVGCVWYEKDSMQDPDHYQYSLYLNIADGSISRTPPNGADLTFHSSDTQDGPSGFPGYGYFDAIDDPVTGTRYYAAVRWDGMGKRDLLDGSGSIILPNYNLSDWNIGALWVWDGLVPAVRDGCFCYYRTDGTCVFRCPIQTNSE